MLHVNLEISNIYVLALKYLERKYKYLLQKNEFFEISSFETIDNKYNRFYFRIFNEKLFQTINKKYYKQLKIETFSNINEQYYEFKPSLINYFRKRKIDTDTYKHIILNYIVYLIYTYKTPDNKIGNLKLPQVAFKKICIKNNILNDIIIDKLSKAGISFTKNSKYTHFNFTDNAKEIYTYLKLAGEIDVFSK